MRFNKKSFRRMVIGLSTFIVLGAVLVHFIGRFLVVDQRPLPSDAVILLSGDVGRLEKSVELMREGYADKLILTKTDGRGRGEISLRSVVQAGVPPEAIYPDYMAISTYTNAVNSKDIMLEHKFKSAIVVSSNYHMRRVKYIFDKVYKGSGIRLTFVAAPSENFSADRWWSNRQYMRYTMSEYIKLLGYVIKY